jgi:predicted site-specific integrase-resolvase
MSELKPYSSLMTRMFILEKYGARLSMEQVAQVLGVHVQTVYNQLGTGELPVVTYKEGARRWASYDAVADYLDMMSAQAKAARKP